VGIIPSLPRIKYIINITTTAATQNHPFLYIYTIIDPVENKIQTPDPLTPPPIPASSPIHWPKVLLFAALGLFIIVTSVLVGIQIGKNQIEVPPPPTTVDQTNKCVTDKDCPDNHFCDYSQYVAPGPNGPVSGKPYGSQQCILMCQTDNQCQGGLCQTFEIVHGDVSANQKGCVAPNDLTLAININTCCSCPTKIRKSLIGTTGWVAYEPGKYYPTPSTKSCKNAECAPCPSLGP
jgi:hypothetical protein